MLSATLPAATRHQQQMHQVSSRSLMDLSCCCFNKHTGVTTAMHVAINTAVNAPTQHLEIHTYGLERCSLLRLAAAAAIASMPPQQHLAHREVMNA
jgi:hypothetical protein